MVSILKEGGQPQSKRVWLALYICNGKSWKTFLTIALTSKVLYDVETIYVIPDVMCRWIEVS